MKNLKLNIVLYKTLDVFTRQYLILKLNKVLKHWMFSHKTIFKCE